MIEPGGAPGRTSRRDHFQEVVHCCRPRTGGHRAAGRGARAPGRRRGRVRRGPARADRGRRRPRLLRLRGVAGQPRPAGRGPVHRHRRPVRRADPAPGVVARRRLLAGRQAARDGRDRPRARGAAHHRVELRTGSRRDQRRPADPAAPRRRPHATRGVGAAAGRRGRGRPDPAPARRVAGRDSLGLRLVPAAPQSSIDHVDVWADRETGIPLRVEVYGAESAPAFSSEFREFSEETPDASAVDFAVPSGRGPGLRQRPGHRGRRQPVRAVPATRRAGRATAFGRDPGRGRRLRTRRHPDPRDPDARAGGRRRCASSCGGRSGCGRSRRARSSRSARSGCC